MLSLFTYHLSSECLSLFPAGLGWTEFATEMDVWAP